MKMDLYVQRRHYLEFWKRVAVGKVISAGMHVSKVICTSMAAQEYRKATLPRTPTKQHCRFLAAIGFLQSRANGPAIQWSNLQRIANYVAARCRSIYSIQGADSNINYMQKSECTCR